MKKLSYAIASLCVCGAATVAGCGGSGSAMTTDSTSGQAAASPVLIVTAATTITKECVKLSFGQGGIEAHEAVNEATDVLIEEFKAAPDERLDLGELRANTPRRALELVLTSFLEGCDDAATNDVYQALFSVRSPD